MRTSLNEIKAIEDFLLHKKDHHGLMSKRLLDSDLYEKIEIQKHLYTVIQGFGRKEVSEDIREAERAFFEAPKFQTIVQSIHQLFSKKS